MPSPFDTALARADSTIAEVMMTEWQIDGKSYLATFDENPQLMQGKYQDEYLVNGSLRTLTLFRSSGYKPKVGHKVVCDEKHYVVQGFSFLDGMIVLTLE